jgi:hypothetical protein
MNVWKSERGLLVSSLRPLLLSDLPLKLTPADEEIHFPDVQISVYHQFVFLQKIHVEVSVRHYLVQQRDNLPRPLHDVHHSGLQISSLKGARPISLMISWLQRRCLRQKVPFPTTL